MAATFAFLLFAWIGLTGELSLGTVLEGAALAALLLSVSRFQGRLGLRPGKLPRAISLLVYFHKELLLSNASVARSILSPLATLRPGIVAVPLDVTSDAGITVLANLITLTPGTLSLDVSADRKTLYVHALHVEDADSFRREIKEGFERRVREVFE